MRVSIQLPPYSSSFERRSRCGCVSLPALAWSKTCQEAYENAMKDMKWAGLCLRVCSSASEPVFVLWLFWALYNLSSAVLVKEIRDIDIHGHQTWAPFLPSCLPAFIHSRHIFLLSFHPVFSPSSYLWSRLWFTRWLLALISVRAVLWWREGFLLFPSPSSLLTLLLALFLSLSRWSLWIRMCCFWELHVSLMRPGNWRATVDIPCIAIDGS